MDLSLKGKTALVSGGSQGIGKAAAIELANLGAQIILMSRNMDTLENVIRELPGDNSRNHKAIAADLSDTSGLKKAMADVVNENNVIHILVNNSGGPAPGPAHKALEEDFEAAFRQHLSGGQVMVKAVLPGMMSVGYGRIINVISTSVKQPIHNLGVSNTIRAAVANWAKTLSSELAIYGITVNNVLPGATHTDRLKNIIENRVRKSNALQSEVESDMKSEIPAGRFATPGEIANAIAFLASPAAAYINGINLPVDGGRTACL